MDKPGYVLKQFFNFRTDSQVFVVCRVIQPAQYTTVLLSLVGDITTSTTTTTTILRPPGLCLGLPR